MKTLRIFMFMTVLIISGMSLTGCENRKDSDTLQSDTNYQHPETTGEKDMDSNEKQQVLDSISVLVSQIETLSETNNNKLITISKEIEDLKGSSHFFDLISWLIAGISLVIAMIAIISFNSIRKRCNRHRNELGKMEQKISMLAQNTISSPVQAKSSYSGISNREYTSLTSRIRLIEHQLDQITKNQTTIQQNIVQTGSHSEVCPYTNEQKGYFDLPTQMSLTEAYFKKLYDIRTSDSRFLVSIKENKAEFTPIEGTQYLNDLRSYDDIKMALIIQGCAPSEATKMTVNQPGEVKKDGDRWIITKRATITLS